MEEEESKMEEENTRQEDMLMELQIEGKTRTLFGRLDRRRIQGNNGTTKYDGDIILLAGVSKLDEQVCAGGSHYRNLMLRRISVERISLT